ncbi:DUF4215 domain-containing protein [Stigmatella sp. ncwal1]|uniref:DUF4215 domain-containing protein n=1 Tax=Stigmatella ashevillensis TaxID=2995309 RepID=A0ABT5DG67_9BACT|nr:DUF4215 domain-containing protein [Stigmatella ashevillena]MDC0712661.1 DUF4215 domain-containing protein [Stigmatella ashevillena]
MLSLSALFFFSCYKSEATTCSSGRVCPAPLTCSLEGDKCVTVGECGDGVKQADEKCDDENKNDGDGCSADCLSLEMCGDRVRNYGKVINVRNEPVSFYELCDDGGNVSGDGCSADCLSLEICGNGIIDVAVGEVCDQIGNTEDGDGCSGDCKSKELCGDGIVNKSKGETCDSSDRTQCSPNCRAIGGCRNGLREGSEECDDGNDVDDDGCRNNCTAARCGDGVKAPFEECDPSLNDDDSMNNPEKCRADCRASECKDFIVNPHDGEECDSGGVDSRYCRADCKATVCGDGYVNKEAGEECDSKGASGSCSIDCKEIDLGSCGNGSRAWWEACDDGNDNACGSCSAGCWVSQPIESAVGKIEIVGDVTDGVMGIEDGWQFHIDSGRILVVFEFDRNDKWTAGTARLNIGDTNDAKVVADEIVRVIGLLRNTLQVEAEKTGDSVVILTNKAEVGVLGNQALRARPTTEAGVYLKLTGMAGGRGKDCGKGVGCSGPMSLDCLSGLECKAVPGGKFKCCSGNDCG